MDLRLRQGCIKMLCSRGADRVSGRAKPVVSGGVRGHAPPGKFLLLRLSKTNFGAF